MNFNEINLKSELIRALAKWDYHTATEIQSKTIPIALNGQDVIGQSHTGTGKTAAFLLPILNNLNVSFRGVQAVIVCPTRELANQVLDQVRKYSYFLDGVNGVLLCGGSNIRDQIYRLKRSNIVVGTPGRIVDHINRGTLRLKSVNTIVLDEADEMLKMGFKNDIDIIFDSITSTYQTLLFSATMPRGVIEIANRYQKDAVSVAVTKNLTEQNNIDQYYIDTYGKSKDQALISLFKNIKPKLSIIFSNTKSYTERISKLLDDNGIKSVIINGDKKQGERVRAMRAFRDGKVKILIATDVAARGIDVDGIDYIFNYDIPREHESYIHRIGRTARAGAKGTAITLVSTKGNLMELRKLERFQNRKIERLTI